MKYYVYKHIFPNNKIYIGRTTTELNQRWQSGFGYESNEKMFKDIVKYGWDNIKHKFIELDSIEDMEFLESIMIFEEKPYYNRINGKLTEEIRKINKEEKDKNNPFKNCPLLIYRHEKMTTILRNEGRSRGGKIGGSKGGSKKGKTNNTKKCTIRYNGCPVMECDSKKTAAEILNVNPVSLTKDETKMNLELGCFYWETLDPKLRTII